MPTLHELYAGHANDMIELEHRGEQREAIDGFLQENFQRSLADILSRDEGGIDLYLVARKQEESYRYEMLVIHHQGNLSRYLEGRADENPLLRERFAPYQAAKKCLHFHGPNTVAALEKLMRKSS